MSTDYTSFSFCSFNLYNIHFAKVPVGAEGENRLKFIEWQWPQLQKRNSFGFNILLDMKKNG